MIDHYTDPDRVLCGLFGATVAAEPARHTKYASAQRVFPVSTPMDAALSLAYAVVQADEVPAPVFEKVAAAAMAFGLDIDRVAQMAFDAWEAHRQRPTQKTAAQQPIYAYDEQRKLPIHTPQHTRLSLQAFPKMAKHLTHEEQQSVGDVLVRAAQAFDLDHTDVPDDLMHHTEAVCCDLRKLAETLTQRTWMAEQPWGQKYATLALTALEMAQTRGAVVDDLAQLQVACVKLASLDEQSGVDKKYALGVATPQQAVYNTRKAAGATATLAGKSVDLTQIEALGAAQVGDLLGEDIAQELFPSGTFDPSAAMMVLPTLPRDQQLLLTQTLGV